MEEFVVETPQMRLYNPKPRSYKYGMKNSNYRLEQMEKAKEKSALSVGNLNKRETRILGIILGSIDTQRDTLVVEMETQKQKLLQLDHQRRITHKALQESLKNGFVALNQFQNSGLRNKVITDIAKQSTPSKLRKHKIEKLSRKSLQESQEIGRRNTALFNQKFPNREALTFSRISEPILRTGNTPTASGTPDPTSHKTVQTMTTSTKKGTTVKTHRVKMPKIVTDPDSDDSYDEGGFTPRPRPASTNNFITKLPRLASEQNMFITAGGQEGVK